MTTKQRYQERHRGRYRVFFVCVRIVQLLLFLNFTIAAFCTSFHQVSTRKKEPLDFTNINSRRQGGMTGDIFFFFIVSFVFY